MSKDPVKEVKYQIALLEEVMNSFDEIDNKPNVDSVRKKMLALVNKFQKSPYDFFYTKDDAKKEIYLWWGEERKRQGMRPEITIYLNRQEPIVFLVSNDCLIGTLQGLYEQLEEYRAYESM